MTRYRFGWYPFNKPMFWLVWFTASTVIDALMATPQGWLNWNMFVHTLTNIFIILWFYTRWNTTTYWT